MSVYTSIHPQQLEEFLNQYSLGTLIQFSGIQAGIENTNYKVITSQGDFILTIFEALPPLKLPYYLQLLNHLNQSGFPAPKPYACKNNYFINTLAHKPTTLFNLLPGLSIEKPSVSQCLEIGKYLAKLHLLGSSSTFYKKNQKNLIGCQRILKTTEHVLSSQTINLIQSELDYQLAYQHPRLPKGVIHADLFKDNVLFNQGQVSGILDFYNACNDYFLFDIAVTCNDWCTENNHINQKKIDALLAGYHKVRKLDQDEKIHLPLFLRLAALCFWLSRLEHQLNPKESELTLEKDPLVFQRLLEYHRSTQ